MRGNTTNKAKSYFGKVMQAAISANGGEFNFQSHKAAKIAGISPAITIFLKALQILVMIAPGRYKPGKNFGRLKDPSTWDGLASEAFDWIQRYEAKKAYKRIRRQYILSAQKEKGLENLFEASGLPETVNEIYFRATDSKGKTFEVTASGGNMETVADAITLFLDQNFSDNEDDDN